MPTQSITLRNSMRRKIRWIILYFDGDDLAIWVSLLQSLFAFLPSSVQFVVFCSEQKHLELLWENRDGFSNGKIIKKIHQTQALEGAKCYLQYAPHLETAMNLWCRDPFFFKFPSSTSSVICLSKTGYASEITFPNDILMRLDFSTIEIAEADDADSNAALYLSGGNLLMDNDFVLVGYSEFQRTWNNPKPSTIPFCSSILDEQEAISDLLIWVNGKKKGEIRQVHLLGKDIAYPKASPFLGDKMFAHIDTHVSLTGTYKTDKMGKNKYVVLVARIEQLCLPSQVAKTDWEGVLAEWNTYLDAIARQLETIGCFEVRRNPVPLFLFCTWDWDNARHLPVRPYLGLLNNVLIEITKKRKSVWLSTLTPPPYRTDATAESLATLEHNNAALWTELGFKVQIIPTNFHVFWQNLGGLRCLTNHF